MDNRSDNLWEYLDFELQILRSSAGRYTVQVLRSPEAGEPEAEIELPLEGEALGARLEELEDALYISSETRGERSTEEPPSSTTPPAQTIRDFGEELFRAVFRDEIQSAYRISLNNARNQNKGLRLKLRIHPSSGLTQVPWEFLYDPGFNRFLVLSARRPLVRYLSLPHPTIPLEVTPPLKILGMVANPEGLPPLDVEREKQVVEKATERVRANGKVEITWIEGETWQDLEREIRSGRWHIFHFVGHGSFDYTRQQGALMLSDEESQPHSFSAENLANILAEGDDLRLVFLNSCEGARGDEGDALSSAAATIVSRGVPAAVAMQYEISDDAAIEFSRSFYEAVADNLPVDAAVAAGRTSLNNKGTDILEWGTPVLYMHTPDGRIFVGDDVISQYRDAIESVWNGRWLQRSGADQLRDMARNGLKLAPGTAASIEREVMGNTLDNILERQQRASRWSRVRGWARNNRMLAVASSLVVVALLGLLAYRIVDPIRESRAVENVLVDHYEKVGKEKYRAAFADFSEAEQDRRGSPSEYASGLTTWCQDVGADVRQPQIDVEGNEATGTVGVLYHTTCGPLPHKFDTEITYKWNLVKGPDGWKLDSNEEERTEYTRLPSEVENGGKTDSDFSGDEKGPLDSIHASNTAISGQDACGDTFDYDPGNIVDGREDTAWQVGGTGVDQWIELKYDRPIKVKRIGIVPGYVKIDRCDGTDRFYQYYVVRKARIQFSDGPSIVADFEKKPEMQFETVDGRETTSLRITILETYPPGDKPGGTPYDYDDTGTIGKASISEIEVEEE